MGRKLIIFVFLVSLLFMPAIGFNLAFSRSMLVTDAENDVCPVTKEEIVTKKFNTTYNGKRYWFINYSAVREFKSNPEKYLRNLNQSSAAPKREIEVKKNIARPSPTQAPAAAEKKETAKPKRSWW
ncbi:MAG: hypothetical protein PHV17_06555 [Candidatus Omnitrophica bacterium]|nr:hypothetical protein [Candidatus Omnitrophota bacterium]